MELSKDQINTLSKYFADFSKILVASVVIAFFLPQGVETISMTTFSIGTSVAVASLVLSVRLAK